MTLKSARCKFLLCHDDAEEAVRIRGIYSEERRTTRDVPMCKQCAEDVGLALHRGLSLYMTPEYTVYVGNLDRYVKAL